MINQEITYREVTPEYIEQETKAALYNALTDEQRKAFDLCIRLRESDAQRPIDAVIPRIELENGMLG